MMKTAMQLDTDMSMWGAGTRHYLTSDGRSLAVKVDPGVTDDEARELNKLLEELGAPFVISGKHRIVPRPTTVLECNEDGSPIDLTPVHTLPAGTPYEDALLTAGYELTE
ncbi:hypothetical protein AIRMID_29 [Mycobacterium phage Airmid]|nr:hypothetical protein AIRMID_29 [Mycobacterium phage Airmid]